MKKEWAAVFFAILLITSLLGCAHQANIPFEPDTTVSPSEKPVPTAMLQKPADLLEAFDVSAIQQISVSDDSGLNPVQYSTDADIAAVTKWISQLEAGDALSPMETGVPGSWLRYEFKSFDGRSLKINLSSNAIDVDGIQFHYTGSPTPDLKKTLWLDVDGDNFPAGTENINFSVINETETEVVLLFVPVLERATLNGWVRLECAESFCGVPDPITSKLVDHELPLPQWFPDAEPGVYRLSLEAYDENDNPYMISDIFVLES